MQLKSSFQVSFTLWYFTNICLNWKFSNLGVNSMIISRDHRYIHLQFIHEKSERIHYDKEKVLKIEEAFL